MFAIVPLRSVVTKVSVVTILPSSVGIPKINIYLHMIITEGPILILLTKVAVIVIVVTQVTVVTVVTVVTLVTLNLHKYIHFKFCICLNCFQKQM